MELATTFGDRIHKLRKGLRMTQSQFAARIGTKAANIDAWERDRNMPRNVVDIAKAIEEELDVQPRGWLLGYRDGEHISMALRPDPRGIRTMLPIDAISGFPRSRDPLPPGDRRAHPETEAAAA